jgi:hypothetical protein
MARSWLAARRAAVVGLALGLTAVTLTACAGGPAAGPPPALPPCEPLIPTYPIKPQRSQGSEGLVYEQTLAPIVPADLTRAVLCRYRDGALTRTVVLPSGDFARLPGLLDGLIGDRPRTCPEPTAGLADDVLILTGAGGVTRIFVQHGECRYVRLIGQIRRASKELLAWLDQKLGGEGDTPST